MNRRDFLQTIGLAASLVPQQATAVTSADLPLPDWARTGRFAYMALDGGPLEAEKGLRSGWEHFTRADPNGVVKAVRDLYRLENVEIPLAANANWVYVTWTNGWSKERERQEQWPLAKRFMEECRRHNIHTSVYISAANMFWEDYLERVPQSRTWIESVEPSALRHYGGSLYRTMANVRLPEWRNEIKTSIDAALDAGAEGFWIDNLFWWHGRPLFEDFVNEMQQYAGRRKSNLVWHTNVNRGAYNWARVGNVVGTEDGRTAKFDEHATPGVSGNLGLLSFISGLKEGWRSAELEHYGNDLSADTRQLLIAECWAWQVGFTIFPPDRLMQARWHQRDPAAWKILEAMGFYNRHQLKYAEWFGEGEPLARIGIIGHAGCMGDDLATQRRTSKGQGELIALLDYLAGSGLQFEVLFEDRLRPEALARFSLIAMIDPEHAPEGAAEALAGYRGALVCPPSFATTASNRIELAAEAFDVKRRPQLLFEALATKQSTASVHVQGPRGVIHRALRQRGAILVHLVNYHMKAIEPVTVRLSGSAVRVSVLVPEESGVRPLEVRHDGGFTVVTVPPFRIHAAVRFESPFNRG